MRASCRPAPFGPRLTYSNDGSCLASVVGVLEGVKAFLDLWTFFVTPSLWQGRRARDRADWHSSPVKADGELLAEMCVRHHMPVLPCGTQVQTDF